MLTGTLSTAGQKKGLPTAAARKCERPMTSPDQSEDCRKNVRYKGIYKKGQERLHTGYVNPLKQFYSRHIC